MNAALHPVSSFYILSSLWFVHFELQVKVTENKEAVQQLKSLPHFKLLFLKLSHITVETKHRNLL